ncbi:MAG: CinA family protein [Bacilli bacterium]|nr:CinA family protein [Bacilli bacterium]
MNEANKLIKMLIKTKNTIGSVESVTGGFFISTLIKIPGASKVVRGALVTYQTNLKTNLLGINKKTIDKFGVVSDKVAELMATNGYKKLGSDIVISFTGNAGPTKEKGSTNVGDIYIGMKHNRTTKVFFLSLSGSRNDIIKKAVLEAIYIIINELKQ